MTASQVVGGWIELNPMEIGKKYTIPFSYNTKIEGYPDLFLPGGMPNDGDTLVFNYEEKDESLPTRPAPDNHDFGYKYKCDAWGNYHGQDMWDELYRDICYASTNKWRRRMGGIRYWGLNKLGLGTLAWKYQYKSPASIPLKYRHYYGSSDLAISERSKAPVLTIEDGRLVMLPGEE